MDKARIDAWLVLHERCRFAGEYLVDRNGAPWSARDYQVDSLESYALRKVHCDGRDVGKTTEIELMVLWASVACPNREMLVATQCENHLYPLMKRILERLQSTELFSGNVVEIRRSPAWHIRFANGFVLWGWMAGSRGVNFQGMHVDWQVVDEAQELTESSWGELYQALTFGWTLCIVMVSVGIFVLFFGYTTMFSFIIDFVRVPMYLAIVGTLCLALGSVLWYIGIAFSATVYRYPFTREIGKAVL